MSDGPGSHPHDQHERCAICLEAYDHGAPATRLDCGHSFHARCAITWFRTPTNEGRCPLCRGEPIGAIFHSGAAARCSLLRRKARGADAPIRLKRAAEKVRKAEKLLKEHRKDLNEFSRRDDVKAVTAECRRLRRRGYADYQRVRRLKVALAHFEDPDIHVPMFTWSEIRTIPWVRRRGAYW